MRLEIEKPLETREWSNKDFNTKRVQVTLEGDEQPADIRIYFADKLTIFEKGLFDGLPYLPYKADPATGDEFKLMPCIALDRRYGFYYVKVDKPQLVKYIDLVK